MPKAYQKLIVVLFILNCFTVFSQTEKTQQQKNEEYGQTLKKWFDSGDLIIEGFVEDVVFIDSANNRLKGGMGIGYGCCKVKIYRILKGTLKSGYLNSKTNSPYKQEAVMIQNEPLKDISCSIGFEGRYVFKMQLIDAEECFTTENKGVYTPVGKVYQLESVGTDMHYKMVEGKKTTYNSTETFYKFLYEYCGVKP